MNPTIVSTTLLLFIGAVNGVSLTLGDYDVDGISVQFGALCDASSDEWYLNGQKSSVFDDWAIELELTDEFAVSSGDTISFEIRGSKVVSDSNQWGEGDMFMAFGAGEKYIAFGLDFDGGLGNWAGRNSANNINGMLIYPPCSGEDLLATGRVSELLEGVSSHLNPWGTYDARYAVRDLLAGGDRSQWGLFSGESIYNEDNWPVKIDIVMGDDEVTFRFSSRSVSAECTYSDTFADGDFVFGMLGEPENGDKDNFYIESIDVSVSKAVPTGNLLCETSLWNVVKGDFTYNAADCSLTASDGLPTMWFGNADGDIASEGIGYYDDKFVLTVELSFQDVSEDASIFFRANKLGDVIDDSDTYMVSFDKWGPDTMMYFFISTLPLNFLVWGQDVFYSDTIYTITVHADGDVYNVYFDGVLQSTLTDITTSERSTGTIGLAGGEGVTFHSLVYQKDPSLNAAAHSMSVEGDNGAEHDAVQKPMDDMNPIALTLIGAVVVVVIALLFVMMRGRTKKEQTAKETVAEMSEVVDAPNVVHVGDDTVEVTTETAVAEPSIPETTVNGMEEAVEVKVNTESV